MSFQSSLQNFQEAMIWQGLNVLRMDLGDLLVLSSSMCGEEISFFGSHGQGGRT